MKFRTFFSTLCAVFTLLCTISIAFAAGNVDLKGNWVPEVKQGLESLIEAHANQGKIAVFDWDNTSQCRDIGEATMAAMIEKGKLSTKNVAQNLTPDFVLDGKNVSIRTESSLDEYYEKFLLATKHQTGEKSPYANSYAWVVQIMAGMTPADILPFSSKGYAHGIGAADTNSPSLAETKINGYRQPFIYPEMANLYGNLIKNGYQVYIASASNIWTVRWMVLENLNPMLKAQFGEDVFIPADHVMGITVLLRDKRDGQLYKDQLLVKTNKAYANLDRKELANYELTTQIGYPLTGYAGKLAAIMKNITMERPFLIGGDSTNDLTMLDYAENRLWITRLEKMGYQKDMVARKKGSMPGQWFSQPVLYKKAPGFVSSSKDLKNRLSAAPAKLKTPEAVVDYLKENGALPRFF